MNYLKKITSHRSNNDNSKSNHDLVKATERDRDRIIQSAAIRRLQQKTQVYSLETNAAVRSRLTHSLEVQQIGRYIARTILSKLHTSGQLEKHKLKGIETAFLNLVEMSCLMHDVGNPPFGHFGEAAISQWMKTNAKPNHQISLKNQPGNSALFRDILLPDLCEFEGNAQGVRIIHTLQGLNLSFSQIAAVMKYTRPPFETKPQKSDPYYYRKKKPGFYYSEQSLIKNIGSTLDIKDGCRFPLVYIMEAADDISYCISDLEDAVDKGILSLKELQLQLHQVWYELAPANNTYLIDMMQRSNEANSTSIFIVYMRDLLVNDLVDYASSKYIENHTDIFNGTLDTSLISNGSTQHLALKTLKTVATRHIFNCRGKEDPELRGHTALMGLLDIYQSLLKLTRREFEAIAYKDDSEHFIEQRLYHRLPIKYKGAYRHAISEINKKHNTMDINNDCEWYYRARLIIDYISGMTDHFVVTEYQNISAI